MMRNVTVAIVIAILIQAVYRVTCAGNDTNPTSGNGTEVNKTGKDGESDPGRNAGGSSGGYHHHGGVSGLFGPHFFILVIIAMLTAFN